MDLFMVEHSQHVLIAIQPYCHLEGHGVFYIGIVLWHVGFYFGNSHSDTKNLSQVDLTKSHKGLFVMILALTMQIKSVALTGNHFRPFITYIILYPDTPSKEACLMMMGYDGICGFIGCEPRRVGLFRFHLGVVGHISLRPHKENHFRPLNMRNILGWCFPQ